MARITSVRPAARATCIEASMVSVQALAEMGRTMPVVPRMDRPPRMPSRRLRVFSASTSPSRTKIVISRFFVFSCWAKASSTASQIICRGTGLMAGSPTATARPGLVTRPTPGPLTSMIGSCNAPSSQRTSAPISAPLVTSGSSPASLTTEAMAPPSSSRRTRHRAKRWREPSGKGISTASSTAPNRQRTAAFAAAAAQAPVV